MDSTYPHPPADPVIAGVVESLNLSLGLLPELQTAFQAELAQGKSLAECRGVTAAELDNLYIVAADLCDENQFRHALPIALQLAAHQPDDTRFQFIGATCLQRLGQHEAAAQMYAMTLQLDETHAAAAYRLGECLLSCGQTEQARQQFAITVELSRGQFHWQEYQDLANSHLQTLLP